MKKTFIFSLLISVVLCFAMISCDKNKNAVPNDVKVDTTQVVDGQTAELNVENLVNLDKQYMFNTYGKDYRWYETCIVLKDFMDEENDGTVTGVSNIFQVVFEKGNGADVNVVMITHVGDSTQVDVKRGFWVEDYPMNDDVIKVSFKEAYDNVMAVNYPKPHSRHIVLRKEVGPQDANPQYIFGNSQAQLYVDAGTGNVVDKNPVFPANLNMPLGEWP